MQVYDAYHRPYTATVYKHSARRAALRLAPAAGDPASVLDGDLWYNSTTAKFRKRQNGATSDLSYGGVPSGATVPTAPATGDLFLHTPTGRKYLLEYDGSAWKPLAAYATTALYVNGTSGSDATDQGSGTGADAYLTVQYAIDQIPAILYGNVTVTIEAGTYRETVTIQGKHLAGDYLITLTGAMTVQSGFPLTATSGANPVGNGVAGFGTITRSTSSFTVNLYRDKLVEITSGTGAGQIRVVHSNTATVLTTVGRWDTPPDNTSVFRVLEWGTRLTGSNAGADTTPVRDIVVKVTKGQRGVVLDRLRLDYATSYNVFVNNQSWCDLSNCWIQQSGYSGAQYDCAAADSVGTCVFLSNSAIGLHFTTSSYANYVSQCRFTGTGTDSLGVQLSSSSVNYFLQNYVGMTGASALQVTVLDRSSLKYGDYCEFEGSTTAPSSDNIAVYDGSIATFNGTTSTTVVVRNAGGWGMFCARAGQGIAASTLTYTGNVSGTHTPVTALVGGTT